MSNDREHHDPAVAYFESSDFDPNRFMAGLVYDPPGTPSDLPVPPPLSDQDVVVVSRTYKLPLDVDAELQAAAVAQRVSVEELLRRWTRQHHAA